MQIELNKISKETVTCPSCEMELELDSNESSQRKFVCPSCKETYELASTTIQEEIPQILKNGKMPFTYNDWIDIWFGPIMFTFVTSCIYYTILVNGDDLHWIAFIFLIHTLIQLYRAISSAKLTFIPSTQSIQRKRELVKRLQDKYRWVVSEAIGGSFVFIDNYFLNRQEILIICTNEGYYLHCMVRASGVGSGISIYQTRRIVKYLTNLSIQA
jgi:uncharacterized protein YbaR (Trm112 family)